MKLVTVKPADLALPSSFCRAATVANSDADIAEMQATRFKDELRSLLQLVKFAEDLHATMVGANHL